MNAPGSTELGMPVCAVATTPLPMRRWPATPTWPASITSSSIVVLPAMPTCAASSTSRPSVTPCAICTRLSIFVPAPIRVSPTAGRSIVVLRADLDVVFDHHVGELRNLQMRAVRLPREAEAVAADDGAVLHDHAIADATRSRIDDVRRGGRSRRRYARAGPITTWG